MPEDALKINGFAEFNHILTFELVKQVGKHSVCTFTLSVHEDQADACLASSGKTISISDSKGPIFYGRVKKVTSELSFGASSVNVEAVSLSILTDEKEKSRIFHNPEKKWKDILAHDRLSLEKCGLRLSSQIAKLPCKAVILQNRETDFAFIRRMAAMIGSFVWIIDTMEEPEICLDTSIGKQKRTLDEKSIISCSQTRENDAESWHVVAKNHVPLGSMVTIKAGSKRSGDLVVTALRIWKEHEFWHYAYDLEPVPEEAKATPDDTAPFFAKIAKLHATVAKVDDPENLGRIQVKFDDKYIEDMDADKALWLPYRSPYTGKAGGVVFMPDPDDIVEAIFINGELYASAALREAALAEECKKVADKYIGNNTEQRIFWKEKSLEIFSGENRIILSEKGIELIVGENLINIKQDGILLKTAESEFSFSSDAVLNTSGLSETKAKEINIKCDGDTTIASSEIKINASSKLSLAGSSIELC